MGSVFKAAGEIKGKWGGERDRMQSVLECIWMISVLCHWNEGEIKRKERKEHVSIIMFDLFISHLFDILVYIFRISSPYYTCFMRDATSFVIIVLKKHTDIPYSPKTHHTPIPSLPIPTSPSLAPTSPYPYPCLSFPSLPLPYLGGLASGGDLYPLRRSQAFRTTLKHE